ncbi:uncharacterized protein M6B38_272205 [Iris pallida]|uniref:Myb-like domain-containing protein n=1 Tax=Iris pallida TaxID=29817 RepID=A0AAX6I7E4_IRIPA|nr:uncharacterized protein M6B38_122275 [Iris pallida]KAJ6848958.1 uncharacterized protein M6B38_272205 [Iris pallida]
MSADSHMRFWREVLRSDSLDCFDPSNAPAGSGGGNPAQARPSSSNAAAAAAAPPPVAGAKVEEGLSEVWTLEEQTILNRALIKYACEHGTMKYIKVASELPRKTVRDVAKRCHRLSRRHDNAKRPRMQEMFALNRMKDRKEKMVVPSLNANIPMVPHGNISSYPPMIHQVNQSDQFSFAVPVLDNATQQLMDRNMQILDIISNNLAACKIQENIDLFRLAKEDIETVLHNMSNMPGKMGLMPPLPVSVNEGLLNEMIMSQTQTVFPLPGFPGFHLEQLPDQPRYGNL